MVQELSGGQQQRVALARALIMRPPVLLLDEPLAALDLKLRQAMQEELRRIHSDIGGTFVFVTHDQGEAMSLANRLGVMHQGEMIQVGSPEDVYRRPKSAFVAAFVGDANILRGSRRAGVVTLEAGARFRSEGPESSVMVVVRPESIAINQARADGECTLRGKIGDMVFLGAHIRYAVDVGSRFDRGVGEPQLDNPDEPRPGGRAVLGPDGGLSSQPDPRVPYRRSADHRHLLWRAAGEQPGAALGDFHVFLMHDHLAGLIFDAGLDGEDHARLDNGSISQHMGWRLGELHAEAVAEPPDIVADRTGLLDDPGHGIKHRRAACSRHRRGEACLGRLPHRLMRPLGSIRDRADGIICGEVAP
jgi:hypothetical protein